MKMNPFKRAICLLLAVMFCLGVVVIPASAAKQSAADERLEDMQKYLDSEGYQSYKNQYLAAGKLPGVGTHTATVVDPSAVIDRAEWSAKPSDPASKKEYAYGPDADYREGVVYSPADGSISFKVDVPVEGMYYIVVQYYTLSETINAVERKLYIDDKMPFSEAASLTFTKSWAYNYQGSVENGVDNRYFEKDAINNDLTPSIAEKQMWMSYICADANGYSNEYYQVYFSQDSHIITFDAVRESVAISSVTLVPTNDATYSVPSYETYRQTIQNLTGGVNTAPATIKTIRAEFPDLVSDSSVTMGNNKNSSITSPSHPYYEWYNVIGATSYNSVGQWAAYNFTVDQTGVYNVTMRYLQNVLDGMFVSRAVKLTSYGQGTYVYGLADGTPTVPFTEAYSARFNYSRNWTVAPISDGQNTFEFYFESGVPYTIYFEVSLGALANELQRVEKALEELNNCYLQILRLTGPDPDENTDYNFKQMIPDTIYNLNKQAVELQDVRDNFARICNVESASHLATLDNIIRQVATMGSDEDEIAPGLTELKTSLGSLGTWITNSKASTLIVDDITVQAPGTELRKANANIFHSAWYEICAFFASFGRKYEYMGLREEPEKGVDSLDVWIATGRDQSKVVRNMIDADFPEYCTNHGVAEVPVALKLVTAGTLLPSILAGRGPDVYMGLDAGSVMNYALRDAVLAVDDAPDFKSETVNFHKAAMDAIKLPNMANIKDSTVADDADEKWDWYGLPMTMSFAMMFYRMDFLVEQGIGVPETWDELLSLLPTLQENNMDIGLNYTLALDFFLYQQEGGNMWKYTDNAEYAGAEIGLDTDQGLSAFEFCTSLYTDYSFPIHFDAANRFRTGEMPILIQDYVGTYNQLIVFATEIEGLWSFSHIPGFQRYNEDGTEKMNADGSRDINYKSMASITAAVITKNGQARKNEAWQYMKWCTDETYISNYSNRIVAILGPSAKYAGANRNALKNMSWTSDERAAIEEQMNQLDTIINYPGSYIIGRYTNFAFLAAANDGEDAVEALRSYIKVINDEITRKRIEFGMSTGKPPAENTPNN